MADAWIWPLIGAGALLAVWLLAWLRWSGTKQGCYTCAKQGNNPGERGRIWHRLHQWRHMVHDQAYQDIQDDENERRPHGPMEDWR